MIAKISNHDIPSIIESQVLLNPIIKKEDQRSPAEPGVEEDPSKGLLVVADL